MRIKFWQQRSPQREHRHQAGASAPYSSLRALAQDWRGILPLACAYADAEELGGLHPSLVAELYPVTPEDVYARLLAALAGEIVSQHERHRRIDLAIGLYNAGQLNKLLWHWEDELPDEAWRLRDVHARLAGLPLDGHTLRDVARAVHVLGLLVSTTVAWDGLLPEETMLVSNHKGRRVKETVEHIDREAQMVRDLATYTPLMREIAAFVAQSEASRIDIV